MKTPRINNKMKFIFIVLCYLFVITLFSNASFAQDDVVKVDTNLITVPTTVLDRNGRYITNLKKEDFQIFEDGVEQEIEFFESVDEPFTILFLLDVSSSMNNYLENLASAANAFFNQLRPDDKIIVVSFCEYIKILSNITPVKDIRGSKQFRLKMYGNTRLYDAVDFGFKYLNKTRGRKAIVVFSDGQDSGVTSNSPAIFSTAKGNLKDAEENDSLIYTVQFNNYAVEIPRYANKKSYYESLESANSYMRNLAQISGGRHYQVEDISNLEETFKMVAEELGQQYSLGFYSKNQGKADEKHQIKVKVRQPNLAVKARESYIVGEQKRKKK